MNSRPPLFIELGWVTLSKSLSYSPTHLTERFEKEKQDDISCPELQKIKVGYKANKGDKGRFVGEERVPKPSLFLWKMVLFYFIQYYIYSIYPDCYRNKGVLLGEGASLIDPYKKD